MSTIRFLIATALLLAGTLGGHDARAAESFDNCTGFIDSLPATVGTQGTWCLRKDLSTAITSSAAIFLVTSNITLDCNGFKLGGLAAGTGSQAYGIWADGANNLTVRNCNIRGFYVGIRLNGRGFLVEDNSLDGNLHSGMHISGSGNRVLRNAVYGTGGVPGQFQAIGIRAEADVIDNTVAGVFGTAASTNPVGIMALAPGTVVARNRVRGLVVAGAGTGIGIYGTFGVVVEGNRIAQPATTNGTGVFSATGSMFCSRNAVANFSTAYFACAPTLDNLTLPLPP